MVSTQESYILSVCNCSTSWTLMGVHGQPQKYSLKSLITNWTKINLLCFHSQMMPRVLQNKRQRRGTSVCGWKQHLLLLLGLKKNKEKISAVCFSSSHAESFLWSRGDSPFPSAGMAEEGERKGVLHVHEELMLTSSHWLVVFVRVWYIFTNWITALGGARETRYLHWTPDS